MSIKVGMWHTDVDSLAKWIKNELYCYTSCTPAESDAACYALACHWLNTITHKPVVGASGQIDHIEAKVAFKNDPTAPCPCGIKRSECEYHR